MFFVLFILTIFLTLIQISLTLFLLPLAVGTGLFALLVAFLVLFSAQQCFFLSTPHFAEHKPPFVSLLVESCSCGVTGPSCFINCFLSFILIVYPDRIILYLYPVSALALLGFSLQSERLFIRRAIT